MPSTFCPECENEIQLNNSARKGEAVTCKGCGAYLVITGTHPFELDWDDSDMDDFDDDDDFDTDDEW